MSRSSKSKRKPTTGPRTGKPDLRKGRGAAGGVRTGTGAGGVGTGKGAGGSAKPGFSKRHPVLRAVIIFAVLMGLFYGLIHTPEAAADPFQPYLAFLATVVGGILRLLGQEITVQGTTVQSPLFSMGIVRGCDALEPAAAFAAAVVASPVSVRFKLPGILIGVVALLVINLIRIVMLFFVGIHLPAMFDLIHLDLWQAIFVVLAIAFWAVWVQWATARPGEAQR